jgi:reactive intermediate/imine deaminase
MGKKVISTARAPAAIGTYSQATRQGNTVYLSGQIPLKPTSMELVEGTIEDQIHQVFLNLQAVCEAAGGSLDGILKLNVFLTTMEYFPAVNSIMAEYFNEPYPARAAVGVAELPRGARVEMDAILGL